MTLEEVQGKGRTCWGKSTTLSPQDPPIISHPGHLSGFPLSAAPVKALEASERSAGVL